MKDLDIMELCQLQGLLFRYREELLRSEQDNVTFGDEELLTEEIRSVESALRVITDDIKYRITN